MSRGHGIAVVGMFIAGVLSACIAGTDPDAVRVLESTARQNALEAAARVKAMGLTEARVAAKGPPSATTLQTGNSGPVAIWMSYVTDAKAGPQALQVSADAYIIGGSPPADITIDVNGAFENGDGYTPFSSKVRRPGAARFYKAWQSSCFQHIKSSANIDAIFFGIYANITWGPVAHGSSKACSDENTCDDAITRKSGRANLDSGMCDDDAPIYGAGSGDTPVDSGGTPTVHCWWYRDMMILLDPKTGKMVTAYWIGEWQHECDDMLLTSGDASRSSTRVPIVLRARGPLGTTERPTMVIAEGGDTVSIAIDTTRATEADLDAALSRAASMWKLKGAARGDSIVATTMAPIQATRKADPGSRGAELLRAVKREASRHVSGRGRSRELITTVARRP